MNYKEFIKKTIIEWYKNRDWEWVWNKVYAYINKKEDETSKRWERYKWGYAKTMNKIIEIRNKIEDEYESYFCFYNKFWHKAWYDWVNWNNKLKELLQLN